MKKVYVLIIIILMISLVACTEESTITPISTSIGNEAVETTESNDENETVKTTGASSENNESEEINETELETIESVVLLEWEGLKITSKELTNDDLWGKGIKVLVENDTDQNITVQLNHLVVNNYMIFDLFSTSVAAGKKANDTIDLSSSALETAGISTIGEVALSFKILNSDTYDRLFESDEIVIKTSGFDSMEVVSLDEGKELLNHDGVRVVGKYVEENTIWGTGVLLFIENKMDDTVIVQCDNMSINGFMVSPYFSSTVNSNRFAMDSITVFETDLEENDIESVEDIELVFKVLDAESYRTLFESDPIEFSVE